MPEKKPYDLQDLLARLKAAGIECAEKDAEAVYGALSGWLKDSASAAVAEGGVVGLVSGAVALVMPELDSVVLPALDKIDGKVG